MFFSFLCTLAFAQNISAQCGPQGCSFPQAQPQEQAVGEAQEFACGTCYCLYVKYEPCYSNCYRTVCEPQVRQKKCTRWVPKYFEKCCVKYVPQYYNQTCCKYEQECYYVDEAYQTQRRVCDRQCKWVPKYYYKKIENPCQQPVCPPTTVETNCCPAS